VWVGDMPEITKSINQSIDWSAASSTGKPRDEIYLERKHIDDVKALAQKIRQK